MTQTLAGLFDTRAEAEQAIIGLIQSGVAREQISLVTRDTPGDHAVEVNSDTDSATKLAAGVVGGLTGGILGALAGVIAVAIPGIGPVLAAGPLGAALGSTGAGMALGAGVGAVGGAIGGVAWPGIAENEARFYAEAIRRGGTLVTIQTDSPDTTPIIAILRRNGAVDPEYRRAEWERESETDGHGTGAVEYYSDQAGPRVTPPTEEPGRENRGPER